MVTSKIELLDQIRQRNANGLQDSGTASPNIVSFL